MCIVFRVKYPLFLSDFNETWIFLDRLSKNAQISNFKRIHPVGADPFRADGQTDMTKLIVAFLQFLQTRLKRSLNSSWKMGGGKKYLSHISNQHVSVDVKY